jgi:Icc-related predicted phosphoesterase
MNICVISDTHMKFPDLPPADLLIHAGDLLSYGSSKQLHRNIQWLSEQKHKFKHGILVVPGNHDRCLDPNFQFSSSYPGPIPTNHSLGNHCKQDFWKKESFAASVHQQWFADNNMFLLIDQSIIIQDYKFYGTPYVLPSGEWAFSQSEEELNVTYAKIPEDIDVLITHGGAYGTLDSGSSGRHFGSIALQSRIMQLKKLQYHVFGHIHYCPGITSVQNGEITYMAVNATYQNEYDRSLGNHIHTIKLA